MLLVLFYENLCLDHHLESSQREKERESLKKRIAAEQAKKERENDQKEFRQIKERSIKPTEGEDVKLGEMNFNKVEGRTNGHEIIYEPDNSTKKVDDQVDDNVSKKSGENSMLTDDQIGSNDMLVQNSAINKLELEIKYDETTNGPKHDTAADEPSFASNNKNSESIVNDVSGNFQPDILIKRQSKDYATTSIETKVQLESKAAYKTTSGDDNLRNLDMSNQKPASGSLKVDKSEIEGDYSNSISEQANIPPSKNVQIDALYFLNKLQFSERIPWRFKVTCWVK